MNLKEAFRYQKFLDRMMHSAATSIQRTDHCLLTKKEHLKSAYNQEEKDMTEVIETDPFVDNDTVIKFIIWLINEKETLSMAIGDAKRNAEIDIDAMIEGNKFRQKASMAISYMLDKKPRQHQENGIGYKFNADGEQKSYYYKIDVSEEELFDRIADKQILRDLNFESEETSAAVDSCMTNTIVNYTPVFSVNESYEDVIADFSDQVKNNT